MAEVLRTLVPGGRVCFNIANLGRKPYLPLHRYVIEDFLALRAPAQPESRFLMRGEIIWDKTGGGASSTAWGSWMSPGQSHPARRPRVHPGLLQGHLAAAQVTGPGTHHQPGRLHGVDPKHLAVPAGRRPVASATRPPSRRNCPAAASNSTPTPARWSSTPSWAGGTTALAALNTGRRFVGYEVSEEYREIAR